MGVKTPENRERNIKIAEEFKSGAKAVDLAKKYDLSRQRIYIIVRKYENIQS